MLPAYHKLPCVPILTTDDVLCCHVPCLNIFSVFSQLRAQNQVLKKAVVDEQANSASLKVKRHIKTKVL